MFEKDFGVKCSLPFCCCGSRTILPPPPTLFLEGSITTANSDDAVVCLQKQPHGGCSFLVAIFSASATLQWAPRKAFWALPIFLDDAQPFQVLLGLGLPNF